MDEKKDPLRNGLIYTYVSPAVARSKLKKAQNALRDKELNNSRRVDPEVLNRIPILKAALDEAFKAVPFLDYRNSAEATSHYALRLIETQAEKINPFEANFSDSEAAMTFSPSIGHNNFVTQSSQIPTSPMLVYVPSNYGSTPTSMINGPMLSMYNAQQSISMSKDVVYQNSNTTTNHIQNITLQSIPSGDNPLHITSSGTMPGDNTDHNSIKQAGNANAPIHINHQATSIYPNSSTAPAAIQVSPSFVQSSVQVCPSSLHNAIPASPSPAHTAFPASPSPAHSAIAASPSPVTTSNHAGDKQPMESAISTHSHSSVISGAEQRKSRRTQSVVSVLQRLAEPTVLIPQKVILTKALDDQVVSPPAKTVPLVAMVESPNPTAADASRLGPIANSNVHEPKEVLVGTASRRSALRRITPTLIASSPTLPSTLMASSPSPRSVLKEASLVPATHSAVQMSGVSMDSRGKSQLGDTGSSIQRRKMPKEYASVLEMRSPVEPRQETGGGALAEPEEESLDVFEIGRGKKAKWKSRYARALAKVQSRSNGRETSMQHNRPSYSIELDLDNEPEVFRGSREQHRRLVSPNTSAFLRGDKSKPQKRPRQTDDPESALETVIETSLGALQGQLRRRNGKASVVVKKSQAINIDDDDLEDSESTDELDEED